MKRKTIYKCLFEKITKVNRLRARHKYEKIISLNDLKLLYKMNGP